MATGLFASLVQVLEMSRQRFLFGLEQVPDDRLSWTPGGSGRTPLQLAGRVVVFLDHRGALLTSRPGETVTRAQPPVFSSRAEAIAQVDGAFRRLSQVLEGLSEEQLQRLVMAPWGKEVPAVVMLFTALNAAGYFQGQLNYVQLAYGDEDPNIPASWKV